MTKANKFQISHTQVQTKNIGSGGKSQQQIKNIQFGKDKIQEQQFGN